jgi:hypothetical protein
VEGIDPVCDTSEMPAMDVPPIDTRSTADEFVLSAFDVELHQLIQQGMDNVPESLERRKLRNELVRRIQRAKVLYQPTAEEQPFYADALSTMWRYFLTHLWESDHARPFSQPGYWIVGRLNKRLRGELQDLRSKAAKQEQRHEQPKLIEGKWLDPVDQLATSSGSELLPLDKALSDWLNTNDEIQQVHIRGRSDITGAIVIRQKLLKDETWQTISTALSCKIPTLSAFYERECRPRLQQFCKDYGYHD